MAKLDLGRVDTEKAKKVAKAVAAGVLMSAPVGTVAGLIKDSKKSNSTKGNGVNNTLGSSNKNTTTKSTTSSNSTKSNKNLGSSDNGKFMMQKLYRTADGKTYTEKQMNAKDLSPATQKAEQKDVKKATKNSNTTRKVTTSGSTSSCKTCK